MTLVLRTLLSVAFCAAGCDSPIDEPEPDVTERDAATSDVITDVADAAVELDASADAHSDVRDTGPDVPWTSEWDRELSLEILDSSPCEEWAPLAALERGLPADSTPRVLWTFSPQDDPRYSVTRADFQNQTWFPIASPDGTIWLMGPNHTDIMQVTRDGRMRRWYHTAAQADGPHVSNALVTMAALPDASVVALTTRAGFGVLQRFSPDWPEDTYAPPSDYDGVGGFEAEAQSQILVGPGGMVYVTGANTITATCQGRRTMWVLRNTVRPGSPRGSGSLHGAYVLPDGDVLASGWNTRVHRVSPVGEITSYFFAPELDRAHWRFINGFVGEYTIVTVADPVDLNASTERTHLFVRGDEVVARVVGRRLTSGPNGRLFFEHDDEWWTATSPEFEPVVIDNVGLFLGTAVFQQDGALVFGVGFPTTAMFGAVFNADENTMEETWRLEGAFRNLNSLAIHETGVSYSADTGTGLVAVQLGELPPPLSWCSRYWCNGYHDRWIRAEN